MRYRFKNLCERLGIEPGSDRVFELLKRMYSESHRAYHNLTHIRNCLDELSEVVELATFPGQVEVAIWFHDAVYDTRAQDNEERSSVLAEDTIRSLGLPSEFASSVATLILATKHDGVAVGVDAQLLVDIDLSILGNPSKEFEQYDSDIRKEYQWVAEGDYYQRRLEILTRFLERTHIFSVGHFREKYEKQARRNLKNVVDRIRSRL